MTLPASTAEMSNVKASPFDKSHKSVRAASFLFPVRKTFVAPMLFDPKARKSMPFLYLVNKKPDGTDPKKYPIKHQIKKFI